MSFHPILLSAMRYATMTLMTLAVAVLSIVPPSFGQTANDSAQAHVEVERPNGQITERDTLAQGETFTFSGLPYPLQYLNGGELTLPDSSLAEDVTITITLPAIAVTNDTQQTVSFGDSVASAVRFEVTVGDSAASPYEFERPVELTLPIPDDLPTEVGPQVSQMTLAFIEEGGVFDTTAVKTAVRDSVNKTLTAEVEHFSTLGITDQDNIEGQTQSHVADVQVQLPDGTITRRDTVSEGASFQMSGFPFPLDHLNGGTLSFPDGSMREDITLTVTLPDIARTDTSAQTVSFGDSLASAVSFDVSVGDSAVATYEFDQAVELTLPIPEDLPTAVGPQVSNMVLAFVEDRATMDTTAIRTTVRDSVEGILTAEVEHFSTVGMTSEENVEEDETTTDAPDRRAELPARFELQQNYPNPFNPSTLIQFALPRAAEVQLTVYDALGREVRVLADGRRPAGTHTIRFDGRNLSSGLYFYRIRAGEEFVKTRSMTLVK